jgi:hypothetical protein
VPLQAALEFFVDGQSQGVAFIDVPRDAALRLAMGSWSTGSCAMRVLAPAARTKH